MVVVNFLIGLCIGALVMLVLVMIVTMAQKLHDKNKGSGPSEFDSWGKE